MRYVIYCRKSTDTEDKQVLSLESQEQELKALADREGLSVVTVLTESMSAKEPGRPRFSELLKLITTDKADAILCWKIDRLTRNPIDGGQIQWLLQTGRIKCIRTFEKSYYPSDNVMLINIEQAMATQYIRDLSTNVKRGNRAKLERGEWPNHAPLGYVNDKATKTITVNKKDSRFIRRAFDLYATGEHTLKQLSDILYKEGLRTSSGKKVAKGHIHRFLSNKFYCGLMEREGKLYTGKHPQIISLGLFNKVQDILLGRKHPRPRKRLYAARGILLCGECGCQLTADTQRGHNYYYCTNGKSICKQHTKYLRSETVHELIAGLLTELKFDLEIIELSAQAFKQTNHRNVQDNSVILETLISEANALLEKEMMLADGYSSKLIREEVYRVKTIEIHNRRIELEQQIHETREKSIDEEATFEQVKKVFLYGNKASELFLTAPEEEKRNHLLNLVSNIIIKDQNIVSYQFKSPFSILANTLKNCDLRTMLAVWDGIRTSLITSSKNYLNHSS